MKHILILSLVSAFDSQKYYGNSKTNYYDNKESCLDVKPFHRLAKGQKKGCKKDEWFENDDTTILDLYDKDWRQDCEPKISSRKKTKNSSRLSHKNGKSKKKVRSKKVSSKKV